MKLLLSLVLAASAGAYASAGAAAARPHGRIVIPRLHLHAVFYNGQRTADTDNGPSHYPWTAMPGHGRTVAIAGHRVTHTHPFRHLELLQPGDLVRIDYGAAPRFRKRACYRVVRSSVVRPSDVSVTRDVGRDRLVLTTCTPPHFATYRLVVYARRAASCS